jgi:hypothetical protein
MSVKCFSKYMRLIAKIGARIFTKQCISVRCGHSFETNSSKKCYCSKRCKHYERNKRFRANKHRKDRSRVCLCGIQFTPVYRNSKYHSDACPSRPKYIRKNPYVKKVFRLRHCKRRRCYNFFMPITPHQMFCSIRCRKANRPRNRRGKPCNSSEATIARRRERVRLFRLLYPNKHRDENCRYKYRKKHLTEPQITSIMSWVKFKRVERTAK